jgi:nucleoside-diphosphate-sugar epimerase
MTKSGETRSGGPSLIGQLTITGSRGFIGTAITKIIDREYYEIDHSLGTDHKILREEKGILIHLSASVFESESYFKPVNYIQNNITDLANMLIKNKFNKVIFASSTAVYDQDGNINPSSIYGITKFAGEQIIKLYARNFWNLRITNPFGPNDKKSVFAKLAQCKKDGEVFHIYENKEATRDFFHVDHIADIVKDILAGNISPGTYNVGSGVATNVYKLLTKICRDHNIKHNFVGEPRGMSPGYIPNTNLLTKKDKRVENEWENYLL